MVLSDRHLSFGLCSFRARSVPIFVPQYVHWVIFGTLCSEIEIVMSHLALLVSRVANSLINPFLNFYIHPTDGSAT
jgi:hypothetical protein